MRRKYIGPRRDASKVEENPVDEKNKPNIEKLDPFEIEERQFDLLTKMPTNSIDSVTSLPDEINAAKKEFEETKKFMNKSQADFQNHLKRIDRIKKLHRNFENDLNILNFSANSNKENMESIKSINKSDTASISKDIISLVEKMTEQRLKVMELQLKNERRQSEKLTNFIKKHMSKIILVNEEMRKELGEEVCSLIENTGKQKIKIMELQFDTEKNQSKELNEKIQDQMTKIEEYDHSIRKQRNKLKKEVKEKTEKLLQAERLSAIGELAARVAHDLRNPLSVIKASVELMKLQNKKQSNEFLVRQLGMFDRGVSRMSHQIEDVLDFVRPIPLHLTKNSILDTIRSSAEKANLSEKFTLVLPEKDIEFFFDKDKIDVVFDNLITNAKQAMKDGGEIILKISESDDFVQIQIQDSGPGIPETIRPKIFEPLITTKQTGTGLGLASVKSIIEQHNGTISIGNNPTSFTIKLPNYPEIDSE